VRRTAQTLDFRFEPGNTSVALRQRGGDLKRIDALRDMLRTVGIPGDYRRRWNKSDRWAWTSLVRPIRPCGGSLNPFEIYN
jgi:hypothetical protein